MVNTAATTPLIARGIVFPKSRASSAMFEIVSMPVYATMPTGIAIRKSDRVGDVPKSTFSQGSPARAQGRCPTTTSRTWVTKSASARKTFSPADSLTPTTLTHREDATTRIPATMSAGDSPSGSQNTPEVVGHEERRDGDRDDVVEHLAPGREEGPELVEGPAGEATTSRRPRGTSSWPRCTSRRCRRRSRPRSRTRLASSRGRRSPRARARSRSSCPRCRRRSRRARPSRARARARGPWGGTQPSAVER